MDIFINYTCRNYSVQYSLVAYFQCLFSSSPIGSPSSHVSSSLRRTGTSHVHRFLTTPDMMASPQLSPIRTSRSRTHGGSWREYMFIIIIYLNFYFSKKNYYNYTVERHEQRYCRNGAIEKINIIIIVKMLLLC